MANVFRKRGFGEAKKEQKRIEKRREEASSSIWRFFLKDDEEDIPVRFLTEEPILFYEHSVKGTSGKWENVTCKGDGCELCEDGAKPSYKGAWLIVDGREFEYTDKNGKKQTGSDQVRLYVRGSTDIAKLDRLSTKYGLTTRPYFATKTGSGTSTSYELDRSEESELSRADLENIVSKLPAKYKVHVDIDDEETFYDVVEDCLFGGVIGSEGQQDEDEEEDDEDDDLERGVRGKKDSSKDKPPVKKKLFKKRS